MRIKRTRGLLVATATGLLTLGIALPASAATTVTTPVTLTVTGGVLGITAATATVGLGTRADTVGGGTISASLGQVQVTDARSAVAGSGWIASVISTALTPSAGPTIGAELIGYTAGTITKVGTATYAANDPLNLTGVSPAVTATGITGDNSATWNPTINVAVPGSTAAGTYTGTITHSVL
jgi:hypothetical protein